MKFNKLVLLLLSMFSLVFVMSCSEDDEHSDDDDHDHDEETEEITQVALTFTNVADLTDIASAIWIDADGDGALEPTIGDIELVTGTEYTLTVTIANTLETPIEDVTAEILEEDADHQLFFGFTEGIFSDPTGVGNADTDLTIGDINYNDADDNDLPLGLSTQWTAGDVTSEAGTFRVVLKHQPDEKSATSTVDDGETDFDIEFVINVVE